MNKLAKKTLSLLISGAMAFSGMTGLALAAENDFAVSAVGSADGSITSITTVNAAAGESAGVGIVAVYTEGMLKGLAVTDSSAVVTAGTYDLKAPLAYNVVSDTYQAFVWNSLNEQKPLTEVYSSSVPEPTVEPTTPPTEGPTTEPTVPPTTEPTTPPTTLPTTEPTTTPTTPPVVVPTVNPTPTPAPVMYTVTVAEGMTNGSVAADKATAAAGEEVTLTVTPAEGYMLDTLTVTDAEDGAVVVTDNKFTMPAKNVTVTATFKADPNVTVEVKSTYVDASSPDENYSASDVRYANSAKLGNGKLSNNGGGQIAILDFDASEYVGKIRSATVSFTATCQDAGKNSRLMMAKFADAVDTTTATWNTVTALEGIVSVNDDIGYGQDAGTPLACDITKILRADEDGKVSLAVYTYTARKQALTDIKVNLVVEQETIPQTTVTVNKVVQGTEPAEIIETNTYDVYAGDAYTATYDETFETPADGVKTAYYKFAGVAGTDDTIASLSETAEENVITLPYTKTAYQVVTFTTSLTDSPKAGVPIKVNGTPTVTGVAIEELSLTTGEDGTIATNLLPGNYSYTIDATTEYLAVEAAPFVVENAALPVDVTLVANQKEQATLKVIYTTDGTIGTKVAEKEVEFDEVKFVGDEATIPSKYVGILKVNDDVTTNMYTVYNFVSGPEDNKVTLSETENTAIVTYSKDKKYYTYEDFEYGTLDGFVSPDMKYLTEGAAGQGMIYKLRTGATWQATNWTTSEAQPITATKTEMTFDMHYGYFGGGDSKNSKFVLTTSGEEEILSVNYNATKCAITSIQIGGVEKLTGDLSGYQDGNDYNASTKKAKIDIVVDYEANMATINLKRDATENTFTGDISSLGTKDIAKWVHTNGINNDSRCSTVDNFKVFVPETAPVE